MHLMWNELIDNRQAISMFDPAPSLSNVVVSQIMLDYNGPTVNFTALILEYPANPPIRWQVQKYNAVSMEFQAMAVSAVQLSGWTTSNQVSIVVNREVDSNLSIEITGDDVKVTIHSGWLRAFKVSPYFRPD